MNQLQEIKNRAEVNRIVGQTASQDEAKDTLKLVAALEAVDAISKRVSQQAVDMYTKARVLPFDERAVAAANAVEFEAIATDIYAAIEEALA